MTQRLFLFQIGPVQSFIAAARRTQDLYVGSRLLSGVASAGVMAAHASGAEMLFPTIENGKPPLSAPHRFAFLSDHEPHGIALEITNALQGRWTAYTNKVRAWLARRLDDRTWGETFDRQVTSWLEVNWVAVPYVADRHGESFTTASRSLAARRAARDFLPVDEPGEKCTLTGAQSALPLDWKTLQGVVGDKKLRDREKLGALATIKRFAQDAGCTLGGKDIEYFLAADAIAGLSDEERKPGMGRQQEGYLAVLHMDGDGIGRHLSSLNLLKQHIEFSRQLAEFADERVPEIVGQFPRSELVYAGGDDVLALLALEHVLECADQIRKAFTDITGLHMSAGIALTPSHLPLDTALDMARLAEHDAKEIYGRSAVAVRETHRSGRIREAGSQWIVDGVSLMETMHELKSAFQPPDEQLSAKIAFDLIDINYALTLLPDSNARAFELARLLKRRSRETLQTEERQALIGNLGPKLLTLGEARTAGWQSLAHWTMLARFLAQGGRTP